MSAEINSVGILAGEGALPLQLAQYCVAKGIAVSVVQFQGCEYSGWPELPTLHTRLERVGDIFKFFKKQGVHDVVMIGNLRRPSLTSLRPDFRGLKTLGRIAGAFAKGDDNLLRSLREEIEGEGFSVRGVDYYLTDLTASVGLLTKTACPYARDFVTKAIEMALKHGFEDKGQSVLAHSDGSFSFEGPEGTTRLIETHGREGSTLVKTVKPQQDPDLDRPTVGPHTLEMLKSKKCAGMIIQANAVFMVDKDDMIAYADAHNLFIEAVHA